MLLSQEKAKIRELGPDGPTPSLDDETLQPADDEIPFFSFLKRKTSTKTSAKGGNLKACVNKNWVKQRSLTVFSMNFPSSHFCGFDSGPQKMRCTCHSFRASSAETARGDGTGPHETKLVLQKR